MNSIYLIQPHFASTINNKKYHWLPYTIGALWSYANQFKEIRENYQLKKIIFRREDPVKVAQSIDDSTAVFAFSCYIWNWEYNKALAKEIKKQHPNSHIIFGGPQISKRPLETSFFKSHPYVDSIIINEGEIGFVECLKDLCNAKNQKIYYSSRLENLDIPSPYLTGVFDQLFADYPEYVWNATLETNRGCPFNCTFCDWGGLIYSKVKKFNEEKVYQELDWMGEHKIDYIAVTDANFGAFKKRDYDIANYICQVKEKTGYPNNLNFAYNKNSNEEVVKIIQLLSKSNLSRGLTLSFQSLNEEVLEHIKRANMAVNQAEKIFHLLNQKHLSYYSELILGLPMETYTSWKENHWKLLNIGQHQCIDIFLAMILENSELNHPEYKEKYQIKTTEVDDFIILNQDHHDPIKEKMRYVKSTSTMSGDELRESFMFSWVITNFHSYGWTQIYARFLHQHCSISYEDFYNEFCDYLKNNQFKKLSEWYHTYKHNLYLYLEDYSTFVEQKLKPNILRDVQFIMHSHSDEIHQILFDYVSEKYKNLLSAFEFDRLREYQTHYVSTYQKKYPYTTTLDLGIHETIVLYKPYVPRMSNVSIEISGKFNDKNDFLSKIETWRRNNWGRTQIIEMPI